MAMDPRNAGGTPGGAGMFLIGLGMFVAGLYLLFQQIDVHGGYWRFGMGNDRSFGLTLVPLLVGVGFLFWNASSKVGWFLAGGGLLIVVAGIIANMQIHWRRTTLFDALLILALQLAFWLALTHLQSRFLLPCLPPLVVLVALGIEELVRRARWLALVLAVVLPAGLGCWCIHLYGQERGGRPATYIDGVMLRTGVGSAGIDPGFLRELAAANSDVYLTHFTDASRGVYLFGDATPFYVLRPVVWHTTWDTSPLGEIIRAHGDDHRAWAAALIERGLPLVLVNEAELSRLAVVDEWYDPVVAASDWRGFFESHARPLMVWPISAEHRRVLYEIIPPR